MKSINLNKKIFFYLLKTRVYLYKSVHLKKYKKELLCLLRTGVYLYKKNKKLLCLLRTGVKVKVL